MNVSDRLVKLTMRRRTLDALENCRLIFEIQRDAKYTHAGKNHSLLVIKRVCFRSSTDIRRISVQLTIKKAMRQIEKGEKGLDKKKNELLNIESLSHNEYDLSESNGILDNRGPIDEDND